jgi:hypothetical protein
MDLQGQPTAAIDLAEQIRNIRANADLVIRMFATETEFVFGYNEHSVEWLDAYIEHIRKTPRTDEEFNQIVANLGSYLGESIIAAHGGSWSLDQRGLAVRWDEVNRAYPFAKVARHLLNGAEDSIYSFYSATAALRKS